MTATLASSASLRTGVVKTFHWATLANTMHDWRDILRREHEGQPDTFFLHLRSGPGWDVTAYDALFAAMLECCKQTQGSDDLPRWIADLFWHLDWYVRQDLDRRWGDRSTIPEYYENAWTNLNHLAHWLFTGEPRADDDFEPIVHPD